MDFFLNALYLEWQVVLIQIQKLFWRKFCNLIRIEGVLLWSPWFWKSQRLLIKSVLVTADPLELLARFRTSFGLPLVRGRVHKLLARPCQFIKSMEIMTLCYFFESSFHIIWLELNLDWLVLAQTPRRLININWRFKYLNLIRKLVRVLHALSFIYAGKILESCDDVSWGYSLSELVWAISLVTILNSGTSEILLGDFCSFLRINCSINVRDPVGTMKVKRSLTLQK